MNSTPTTLPLACSTSALVHAVATWLKQNGWSVVTAELGYIAKMFPELNETQRGEVGDGQWRGDVEFGREECEVVVEVGHASIYRSDGGGLWRPSV